jgi:hypothetical protein
VSINVPQARNTADYCDGIEGLVSASSGGLREELLLLVFSGRAHLLDDDRRKADTSRGTLRAILRRLQDEGRLVMLDAAERRWGTPAHALAAAA